MVSTERQQKKILSEVCWRIIRACTEYNSVLINIKIRIEGTGLIKTAKVSKDIGRFSKEPTRVTI